MKKKLFYTNPSLIVIPGDLAFCGDGSLAAPNEGICDAGLNTSNVASGKCSSGNQIDNSWVCGSGGAPNDGNAASCLSGSTAQGSWWGDCWSGGTADLKQTNCANGTIPGTA